MKPVIVALSAVAACFSLAQAQLVQDSDEPIDITGDSLEIIDDIATWRGNVRAIQGEAILTADRLVAKLDDEGGFTEIEALGTVRYSNGKEAISGARALYSATERSIRISEDVVVTQGKTVMTGGALIYWIDTGRLRFTAPEGRRIRGIFHTKTADIEL